MYLRERRFIILYHVYIPDVGLTGNTKLIAASIQYVINVVMTLPAILFLDRIGRRPALVFGSVMMMTWLYATAALLEHMDTEFLEAWMDSLW